MRILQLCHKPPRPALDGGCLAMDAMTMGFLENGAQVKVLTASTQTHPIRMDELDPAYLDATDLENCSHRDGIRHPGRLCGPDEPGLPTISRFYAHHHAMVIKQACLGGAMT